MEYWLYATNDKGIKLLWQKTPRILWPEIVYIKSELAHDKYGKFYRTTLFTNEKKITITCWQWSPGFAGLQQYGKILARVIQKSTNATTNDISLLLVKWIPEIPNQYQLNGLLSDRCEDVKTMIQMAYISTIRIDFGRARKYIKRVLKTDQQNIDAMGLEALIPIIEPWPRNYKKIFSMYEKLLETEPNNPIFLRNAAISGLYIANLKAVDYAKKLLTISRREIDVSFILSDFYLNNDNYSSAMSVLETIKMELGNKPIYFIEDKIQYAKRYSQDVSFREGENRKEKLKLVLSILFLLLFAGFVIWRILRLIITGIGIFN